MTPWIRHALLISFKDFTQWRRDLWAFGFSLGFPIAFATAFFFFLSPALESGAEESGEPLVVHVSATWEAEDAFGQQITAGLTTSDADERIRFVWISHEDGLRDVKEGRIDGFISFPGSFTADVSQGRGSELVVFSGGDAQAEARLVSVANSLAGEFRLQGIVTSALARLSGGSGSVSPGSTASGFDSSQSGGAVEFSVTEVGDIKPPNAANVTVPGYLVMFIFMAAAFTALTIAEERESGMLERMATSGARPTAIISGKFLSSMYRGVIQVIILGVFGVLAFNISLGEVPAATAVVALLMALASSAFGVLLASFARSARVATPAAVLVSLVAAPLGGSWWPLFILDDWMRDLALITPHGWANTAFNRLMLFGGDFGSVAYEMLALAGFALGFILIAVWRFRVSPL